MGVETSSVGLSIRIPAQVDADLRRIAEREANSIGAVVRRYIMNGLSRERSANEDEAEETR